MDEAAFGEVIADHLELQRRNCGLEQTMPLEHYRQSELPADFVPDLPTQPVSVHEILSADPASWWEEQGGVAPEFDWGP
jgi:hypothetical protein